MLGDWIERVRLLCTVYDSSAGRYRFDYSIFVAAGVGVLCLGAVGVFIVPGMARRRAGEALRLNAFTDDGRIRYAAGVRLRSASGRLVMRGGITS